MFLLQQLLLLALEVLLLKCQSELFGPLRVTQVILDESGLGLTTPLLVLAFLLVGILLLSSLTIVLLGGTLVLGFVKEVEAEHGRLLMRLVIAADLLVLHRRFAGDVLSIPSLFW